MGRHQEAPNERGDAEPSAVKGVRGTQTLTSTDRTNQTSDPRAGGRVGSGSRHGSRCVVRTGRCRSVHLTALPALPQGRRVATACWDGTAAAARTPGVRGAHRNRANIPRPSPSRRTCRSERGASPPKSLRLLGPSWQDRSWVCSAADLEKDRRGNVRLAAGGVALGGHRWPTIQIAL